MTYLITGATGFVGKQLVEHLLAEGHSVQYLGRKRDRTMDLRAAFHLWENPSGSPPALNAVPRCDAVIHLVGEPIAQRWTPEIKRKIFDSRVKSTRNLVAAIATLRHKPSVLVSASAIGFYGDRGDQVLTERDHAGNGFLAELCTAWEREADLTSEYGLRVIKIRVGVVLGSQGGALKKILPLFRAGLGGRLGSGRQWVSWIHESDLVRAICWAADRSDVSGAVNGCAPQPVTNEEFTKTLAQILHRPAILPAPKLALRFLLGEMADFLFDSIRVVPAVLESGGFNFKYRNLRDALAAIVGN
jgi:uncharacterized protein (TIGR01777 family)